MDSLKKENREVQAKMAQLHKQREQVGEASSEGVWQE